MDVTVARSIVCLIVYCLSIRLQVASRLFLGVSSRLRKFCLCVMLILKLGCVNSDSRFAVKF